MQRVSYAERDGVEIVLPTYPAVFNSDKKLLNEGDKIILPEHLLRDLMHSISTQRKLPNPLVYRIDNLAKSKSSHCGVLEFSSLESSAFLPQWMMDNLLLEPGDKATFTLAENYCRLNYIRLKPLSSKFAKEFDDPKATLENCLRKFTVMTLGDTFLIQSNGKNFTFHVDEVQPDKGNPPFGCIVDADLKVELDVPVKITDAERILMAGGPAIEAEIKMNKWLFCKFKMTDLTKNAIFRLKSLNGDADLYVSRSKTEPNNLENDFENYCCDKAEKVIVVEFGPTTPSWVYLGVTTLSKLSKFELSAELTEKVETAKKAPQKAEQIETNRSKKCGNCRAFVAENVFSMHSMRCKRVNFWCEKCQKAVSLSEKETHFHCDECDLTSSQNQLRKHKILKHRPVECQCGDMIKPKDLKEHRNNCMMQKTKCKYCKTILKKIDLQEHEGNCGSRTTQCELCGKWVRLNSIVIHKATEHGINPCSQASFQMKGSHGSAPQNDVEQMMLQQAIRESLVNSAQTEADKGRHSESPKRKIPRGQKCPYCQEMKSPDEDIGLHMLRCYEGKNF